MATLFQRIRGFAFTPYLSHCCHELIVAQEYPSDESLPALVRMQHILVKVSSAIPALDQDETVDHVGFAPLYIMMTTARRELDAIVQSQPVKVDRNGMRLFSRDPS